MSKSNFTAKGPSYNLPPRIIGGSVRVFGRSVLEILGFLLALLVALFYLIVVPFPAYDLFNIRLVVAIFLFITILGYMLVPLAGMTPLEWTFALVRYKNSHIPKRTKARPSPPGRYANLSRLSTSAGSASSRRIDLTGSGSKSGAKALAPIAPAEPEPEPASESESELNSDDPDY